MMFNEQYNILLKMFNGLNTFGANLFNILNI